MNTRNPRFKRVADRGFQVTQRDIDILRQLHRHRLLDSNLVAALVGGSAQGVRRRLNLLYHGGLVDRPRAQQRTVYTSGSAPMVYALGNKGADVLLEHCGVVRGKTDWGGKNRQLKDRFMAHTLLTAGIMAAFECACRDRPLRMLYFDEILRDLCPPPTKVQNLPQRMAVTLPKVGKMTVTPDAIFGLEFTDRPAGKNRTFFFVEADRGTMPVKREKMVLSSIWKKLRLYHAVYSAGVHTAQFSFKHFRVLFVSTSPDDKRVASMVDAAKGLPSLQGLFLFAPEHVVVGGDPLAAGVWVNGRGEGVGLK